MTAGALGCTYRDMKKSSTPVVADDKFLSDLTGECVKFLGGIRERLNNAFLGGFDKATSGRIIRAIKAVDKATEAVAKMPAAGTAKPTPTKPKAGMTGKKPSKWAPTFEGFKTRDKKPGR